MADSHPTNQANRDEANSRQRWTPSRGFWVGMGGVAAFAAVLVAAGTFAAVREPEAASVAEATPRPEPVQVSVAPRKTTPADGLTRIVVAPDGQAQVLATGGEMATAASAIVESPKTVASSWSMSPLPEDGEPNVITSGTSQDPVQQTSSATVLAVR